MYVRTSNNCVFPQCFLVADNDDTLGISRGLSLLPRSRHYPSFVSNHGFPFYIPFKLLFSIGLPQITIPHVKGAIDIHYWLVYPPNKKEVSQMQAYCVKCRAKREVKNPGT